MGRSSSEGGSVHHNALAPASSPKEVEKGHFAHELGMMLDQAHRAGKLHRLVLVAPAHFLGLLKGELTPEVQKSLVTTIDKDFSHLDGPLLAERLRHLVGLPSAGVGHAEKNHQG